MLFDIRLSNILLNVSSGKGNNSKNKQIGLQTKSFCRAKETVNKMKIQHTAWEKIFANHISNRELISKIHYPGGSDGKASAWNAGDPGLIPGLGRSTGRGNGYSPQLFPGESHGQRSLVGYSPWSHKELDTTEQLTHTSEIYMKNLHNNNNKTN